MVSTWDKSLETGHPLIDRQHRELIALVDGLAKAETESREEVVRVLDHVVDFTLFHFVAEEELMTRVEYPPALTKEMVDQHREFEAYARLRVLEFRRGEETSVQSLQSFLGEWLKVHEFGLDRQLVGWIRRQERASPRGAGKGEQST